MLRVSDLGSKLSDGRLEHVYSNDHKGGLGFGGGSWCLVGWMSNLCFEEERSILAE